MQCHSKKPLLLTNVLLLTKKTSIGAILLCTTDRSFEIYFTTYTGTPPIEGGVTAMKTKNQNQHHLKLAGTLVHNKYRSFTTDTTQKYAHKELRTSHFTFCLCFKSICSSELIL